MATIGGLLSGFTSLMAGAAQASAERAAAEHNAKVKERQATQERERAQLQANEKRDETQRLVASQRAMLASEGQDLTDGQALLITSDTFARGETISRNTEIEGEETAQGLLDDADFERESGKRRASAALLGGFGGFVGGFG